MVATAKEGLAMARKVRIKDKVRLLHAQGLLDDEIAANIGCHIGYVRAARYRMGIYVSNHKGDKVSRLAHAERTVAVLRSRLGAAERALDRLRQEEAA